MKMLLSLCASLLLVSSSLHAASDVDRYLESSTIAVAQVDLSRVDLPATAKFVQTNFPEMMDTKSIDGIQSAAGAIIVTLRGAGVTKVYATLSTFELMRGHVVWILPCSKPEAARAPLESILAMLPSDLGYKVHLNSDSVVVSTDAVWSRLSKFPKAERRALSNAMDQTANVPFSMVVNVREELRSEIMGVLPERLPSGSPIAFSPKALMEDIISLQLVIEAPLHLQGILSANCRDAQSAKRVVALAQQFVQMTGLSSLQCTEAEKQARVSCGGDAFVTLVRNLTQSTRMGSAEMQQSNNLKQIVLALLNFESVYKGFPPRMTVSEKGTPLLSWRVFLLPFIAEQALYNEFHLDEPWDSPHNLKLVERMPAAYQSMQFPELKLGHTLVQMPLQTGSAWNGNENRMLKFQDLTDGTSNTICFVVAPKDKGVVWTKPEDFRLEADNPVTSLFADRELIEVALFDGSIQRLERTIKADILKAMMTHASGEVVER